MAETDPRALVDEVAEIITVRRMALGYREAIAARESAIVVCVDETAALFEAANRIDAVHLAVAEELAASLAARARVR